MAEDRKTLGYDALLRWKREQEGPRTVQSSLGRGGTALDRAAAELAADLRSLETQVQQTAATQGSCSCQDESPWGAKYPLGPPVVEIAAALDLFQRAGLAASVNESGNKVTVTISKAGLP